MIDRKMACARRVNRDEAVVRQMESQTAVRERVSAGIYRLMCLNTNKEAALGPRVRPTDGHRRLFQGGTIFQASSLIRQRQA